MDASMGMREQLLSGLIRLSFQFERFYPQVIKIYFDRKLEEYKEKGIISDYGVDADYIGSFHYSFTIDLFLDEEEVKNIG
jgi:hypothetical protein